MTEGGLGAGLAGSCAACHDRPRGSAGFGSDVATRADSRDAPHLFGIGLVEMLGDEITQDLRAIKTQAITRAQAENRPITLSLRSKGISFGAITAFADSSVNTSRVEGVNPNLRVLPFFAQGGTMSLREFIVGASKAEMEMEAADPVLRVATDPVAPLAVTSPSGMVFGPALDNIERPWLCDPNQDGDGDGVVKEIDPALVDHMEFYLLNYFKPVATSWIRSTARSVMSRA
jgi:hypothetical protein